MYFIVYLYFVGVLKTFIHFDMDFLYPAVAHFLFEVFRLCVRSAANFEARYVCGAPGWCPAPFPHYKTAAGTSGWYFFSKVFCLVAFAGKYCIAGLRTVRKMCSR